MTVDPKTYYEIVLGIYEKEGWKDKSGVVSFYGFPVDPHGNLLDISAHGDILPARGGGRTKCEHCGQFGEPMSACKHCGAPIE